MVAERVNHVLTKAWAGHISMRVEIYGCREGKSCSNESVEFVLLFELALSNGRRIGLVTVLQR